MLYCAVHAQIQITVIITNQRWSIESLYKFKMLEADTTLYSAQELQRIDSLIEVNMEEHLQSMIAGRIASILSEEMGSYEVSHSPLLSSSYQENVCLLFNKFNENWAKKEEKYLTQIEESSQQRQRQSIHITEKQALLSQNVEEFRVLSKRLSEQNREKKTLISQNFILKEEIMIAKTTLSKQNEEKEMIIEQQNTKISQLSVQLEQIKTKYEQLIIENTLLKEQSQHIQEQMKDLLQQMTNDIESHKLNLITSNIMIQELQETQEEKLKQIAKYSRIHNQNKKIIDILTKITSSFQVNLKDIAQEYTNPQSIYNQFDIFASDRSIITQNLTTFAKDINKFSSNFTQNKSLLASFLHKNTMLEKEVQRLKQLNEVEEKSKNALQAQLSRQKDDHYCTLLEIDRSKRKIEDSLLQNLTNIKRMEEKIHKLEKENKQREDIIRQLSQNLNKVTSENDNLRQSLKAEQLSNYELKQQMVNIKSNLDMMMKTQEDDEDCNFNIVQQLIDKNNELIAQSTLKKHQLQLNQQKMAYQENIIEKQTQQIDSLQEQINKLKEHIKEKDDNVAKQEKAYNILLQRYDILEKYMKEEKEIKRIESMKVYCDQENQTDPMKETVQSRIRRQIVRQAVRSQVEKSHSLLSDKEENKENTVNHNTTNRSLLSNREKQTYKEKIMTLNEIINYMLNYCKGYGQGEIRKGSWFMNQIAKYGREYEQRLIDQSHLAPKLKNMKFIESICKQDENCNRLIKQYETIIEFYFSKSYKMSNSSVSVSPITQQKMNKTVNKSRNPSSSQYIF